MRKFKYSLLGVAVGLVVGIMAFALGFPSVDPSIWRAYAEATGLLPLTSVTPVVWGKLVSWGFSPARIGLLSVGVLAFAVFNILWRLLTLMFRPQGENYNWWRLTVPVMSFLGSALCAFSEPVWRLALSGSPALLTLSLFVLSCDLFLLSFFTGVVYDYDGNATGVFRQNFGITAAILLSGLLIVETPVAILLPVLFAFARRTIVRWVASERYSEHPGEMLVFAPLRSSPWVVGLFWLFGFVLAVAVSGMPTRSGCVRLYLAGTVRDTLGAASPLGWILWTAFALVPFALICRWLPSVAVYGGRLKSGRGLGVLLSGAVSLAAVSPLVRGDLAPFAPMSVSSPFMQAFGAVLSSLAATLALAAFEFFAFHAASRGLAARQLSVIFAFLALIASLAVAGAGVRRSDARQLRKAIAEAVEETVRETRGASWLFTDGSVDVGIKLAARRRNGGLRVLPLAAGEPSSSSENGAALLRDWVTGNSSNLQACAVQGGFDVWERAGRRSPSASGLLARESWPGNVQEYGVVFAGQLKTRMEALLRSGAPSREADPCVREAFAAVFGQLSRIEELRTGQKSH